MGRVYSAEQVASGQIPVLGAHEAAGQYVLRELFEPLMPEQVEGQLFEPDGHGVASAMIYGSTAYGTANLRSDLDVLIFYNPSQAATALPFIGQVLKTAGDTHQVSIEPNPLPVGAIYSDREHGIDPLFAGHLLEIYDRYNGRWSRNNPTSGLDRIAQQADNPAVVNFLAHRYVSSRRTLFAKALIRPPGEVDLDSFQRALELPSAIGRKVVAATMSYDAEPLDLSSRPSMQTRARGALMAVMDDWDIGVIAQHDKLYALDQEYTDVLEQTLDGTVNLKYYGNWVQTNYPEACQLASSLSQHWVDTLRARCKDLKPSKVASLAVGLSQEQFDSAVAMVENCSSSGYN